jgi:hypothetical protein
MLTVRWARLSIEVGELDGVEGSTTIGVLNRVEGMTYGTGSALKSTTKSTMMHKSTMTLSKTSMCKLDLRHLWIDLQNFTLITHLPQPGFESSYSHAKRIHPNRGRRRRRRDASESRRWAPHHCRCTSSSHGFGSMKWKSSIGGKWRVWISTVRAGLNKGVELSGRWLKFSRRFFTAQPELAPSLPPTSARIRHVLKKARDEDGSRKTHVLEVLFKLRAGYNETVD